MEITLVNQDIKLRALEPEDLQFLYQIENDTTFWEVTNVLHPVSLYSLRKFIEEESQDIYTTKQKRWVIAQKDTSLPVGFIDLYDFDPTHSRAGVGIVVTPSHQQKNVASQALDCLISYAFSYLGVRQLYAHIPEDNTASLRLFEKHAFECTGTLIDWIQYRGGFKNVKMYQRINRNYKK